jgi:seryl-tRNA synthetase
MLDIKFIRENPEAVEKAAASKGISDIGINKILELDKNYREFVQSVQQLREKQNYLSKTVRGKPTPEQLSEGKKIKEELDKAEEQLQIVSKELQELLLRIPNLPKPDVKVGKDETENEVIKKYKEPTKLSFPLRDHIALGELLIPIIPPTLIKRDVMKGLGYMEHGADEDIFSLEKDGLMLVGTAEHTIVTMHKDEVFKKENLPRRYVGFSSAFRREAGSYGKDTKGILRVHQFDKVEMVSFVEEGKDDAEHEYLLSLEEKLFQSLEIPYQVLKMCTGDSGFVQARKYDIEAWNTFLMARLLQLAERSLRFLKIFNKKMEVLLFRKF